MPRSWCHVRSPESQRLGNKCKLRLPSPHTSGRSTSGRVVARRYVRWIGDDDVPFLASAVTLQYLPDRGYRWSQIWCIKFISGLAGQRTKRALPQNVGSDKRNVVLCGRVQRPLAQIVLKILLCEPQRRAGNIDAQNFKTGMATGTAGWVR